MTTLLKEMFREHPSLVLTLCYFLITLIGVIYSYFFYHEFGINIVKFVDLSDFLLASIQEPISLVIFLLIGVIVAALYLFDFWVRKRFPGYGRWLQNKSDTSYTDPIGIILVIAVFVFFSVRSFAIFNADEVKAGIIDEYNIQFANASASAPERALALLGNTSRFSYFYDVESNEVLVVPVENIALMRK
jgi:hypothetical protein